MQSKNNLGLKFFNAWRIFKSSLNSKTIYVALFKTMRSFDFMQISRKTISEPAAQNNNGIDDIWLYDLDSKIMAKKCKSISQTIRLNFFNKFKNYVVREYDG